MKENNYICSHITRIVDCKIHSPFILSTDPQMRYHRPVFSHVHVLINDLIQFPSFMPGAQGYLYLAYVLCKVQQQVTFGESRYTEPHCSHRHEEEIEADRDWS